ncbi:MAG: hypothetical protein E6H91_17165, partial [Chloroflexi bacterium]
MASGSDRASNEPTLADLNADYVSAFLRDLEVTPTKRYPQGSPFRSRAACKSLKRLANWLAEERVLKESPLERIKKAPEPKEVRQPLSDQELEQVRFAAGRSGSRDHALVAFMAGTGLRLNEARQLRIADLNLGACQVTVRAMTSKRKKTRVVDFHSAVAREMERYLRTRHDAADTDPLFPTDEGRFFTVDGFGKLFARIRKKSSVRRFHAHLLRHTWATNWMKGPARICSRCSGRAAGSALRWSSAIATPFRSEIGPRSPTRSRRRPSFTTGARRRPSDPRKPPRVRRPCGASCI